MNIRKNRNTKNLSIFSSLKLSPRVVLSICGSPHSLSSLAGERFYAAGIRISNPLRRQQALYGTRSLASRTLQRERIEWALVSGLRQSFENEPIPEEDGVDCYKKYKRIRSPFKVRRARGPAG